MFRHPGYAAFITIGLALYGFQPVMADPKTASDFIAMHSEVDEDCEEKGGERIYIVNQHQQNIIDVHLDRYFSEVRQGGRSMFPLKPEQKQMLGCSLVFDAVQRWQLVSATFLTLKAAEERYGPLP